LNLGGKGNGEEYYKGVLIFKGKYLNWKRNGKGKDYDISGNIIFEGEYLNGKKWNGKVKKYEDGKLIFKKEYINGIKKKINS